VETSQGSAAMSHPRRQVRCREIRAVDLDELIDLLTVGYRVPKRDLWALRLKRLSEYRQPPGFPHYGYLLEHDGVPVGAIFTIFSPNVGHGVTKTRCYIDSWCVKPEFRAYAPMLAMRALSHDDVNYLNVTPEKAVIPIMEAQGYIRFCDGRFIAVPLMTQRSDVAEVEPISPEPPASGDFSQEEIELLQTHADLGCISVTCTAGNVRYPFVFHPRRRWGVVRFARLVYCRDLKDFVRFARPLGSFLIKRGFPLVSLDANGPIGGLVGKYSPNFPKYYKGPEKPRLGNMAYSVQVIWDVSLATAAKRARS
jgi:hypothetical protein